MDGGGDGAQYNPDGATHQRQHDGLGYPTAARTCGHLLPYGGSGISMSPAAVAQLQTDMEKFAHPARSKDDDPGPRYAAPASTRR